MTYDIVLRDGNRIRIGHEKYETIGRIITDKERPEFLEIKEWGILRLDQIIYIEREDDGKFRPEGY